MENKAIDTSIYSIGKDIDGKECDTKMLHDVLLKIVLEIDRVCRKNDIDYALAFGSAMGLYNYGGFIPWDDDLDIVIDYFDIDRFIDALNKDLGEDFTFDCYETNKRYNVLIPTFKIRYKHSYIKERNALTLPNRCLNGDGLFADVVCFMGVPSTRKEHEKLIWYSKRRMPWYCLLDAFLRIHPYHTKKKLKEFEKRVAEKYKDSSMVSQTVIIPFQDYGKRNLSIAFDRNIIYPFKEYDFEGHKLYSFNDVEAFCKLFYGEDSLLKQDENGKWYDPYPQEKRKIRHAKKFSLTRAK